MTDLEKELVEKLAKAWVGTEQNPWDLVSEEQRKSWEALCIEGYLPHIRSYTQALVAAAYAACADAASQDAQVIVTSLGNMESGDATGEELDRAMKAAMNIRPRLCKLTPADAARELERRELEKVIEGLKTARARTLPGCRTIVNLGHVPEAVRAGEWVQMDIEGEIADVEQRLASLSKPAPVSQTITPGICAKHAIVTPTCRNNRTPLGALAEAVERLQLEYIELLNHEGTDAVTYHFVLTVERKPAPVERSNENG